MTLGSAPRGPLAGFVCQLGDVLVRPSGEEAWLAGGLIFAEELPVAVLFIAPEAGGDRAVFVRREPSRAIVWLAPLPADELVFGAEAPTALEHRLTRFERVRRLPVRIDRVGTGAPDVGEQGILAEYEGAGAERLIAIVGPGVARAFRGVRLDEGAYDVLPSGGATLER